MSEQEENKDYLAEDEVVPVSLQRKVRGLGSILAILLWLASVAVAGYLYWRVEGFAGTGGVVSRLGDDIARLETEVARARSVAGTDSEALRADMAALEQELEALGDALRQVQAAVSAEDRRDGALDPKAWRLAEVEYLLRIANNRLLMERDARAADQMLAAADAILEELDDYALHDVRAVLAEERLALANTKAANTQSVFLTLEAIKDALPELPLKQPEYFSRTDASGSERTRDRRTGEGRTNREVGAETASEEQATASDVEPESFGQALRARFYGLFEFRTRESVAPRPLIRPEEAVYLELNLRLALERAQLAMLRGDQTLFATSLNSARQWLDEYVDPEHAATQRVAQDLDSLADLDIEQPMPDISRSLARLLELGRGSADPDPPVEERQAE